MNPIVYAIPVFMMTVLLEAWVAHRKGKAIYDIPDAITSLHHGVLSQITGAFTKIVAFAIYVAVYENYRATQWPTDQLWLWVLALILYDFLYYWFHRMGHEVNLIWASHVVHHSSEYYNLSTALRQTSTGFLFAWIFYLPLAILGVPPVMVATVALIDLLYQYWVHTELIGRLGFLDRLLVTPSNHRVHHGQNDYCIDKNYGGIFIIWDRLFGTFAEEREGEKIYYGIRKPLRSFNPVWGNLHYYVDLWNAALKLKGWRAKLGIWLAPPAGWTLEPIEHFEPEKFERFTAKISLSLRGYVLLQYAILVPFIMHFLASVDKLSVVQSSLYALAIAAGTFSLGGVLEGAAWSRKLEIVRVFGLGIAFVALENWFGFVAPWSLKIIFLLTCLLSGGWFLFISRNIKTPAVQEKIA